MIFTFAELQNCIPVLCICITFISRWEEFGKAHGEFFSEIKPCTTMVEVSKLISPEYLIEIEADAVIE